MLDGADLGAPKSRYMSNRARRVHRRAGCKALPRLCNRRSLIGRLFDSIENVAPALKRLPAREVFIQHGAGAGAGAHDGEQLRIGRKAHNRLGQPAFYVAVAKGALAVWLRTSTRREARCARVDSMCRLKSKNRSEFRLGRILAARVQRTPRRWIDSFYQLILSY
jgi:hypothetical protein